MRSIVIGTAGHIDHGKTSLVKALTGTDTDRLKEEKSRGITIELGFAHLDLGEGLRAGIVDVPGHERFIKNMVAGTSGIDLVLMVIAADEGVMPQTREHLDICNLLGIEHGVVVLTKTDMVDDAEWLTLVEEELRNELTQTFLENSPIVRVSSKTGEGIDKLIEVLGQAALKIEQRSSDAPAYLAIDRAFSMKGFGTVITGTLVAGIFRIEDAVDILPDPKKRARNLKIRGLQVHGLDQLQVQAGQRLAVNLAGVERSILSRGQVLVQANTLEAGHEFEGSLQLVKGAKPIRIRTRAIFHAGTARTEARVDLIGSQVLEPGGQAYARFLCSDPVAALPGQQFILRGFTPIKKRGTTLGGGKIMTILPPRRRRKERDLLIKELETLKHGKLDEHLVILLEHASTAGLNIPGLSMRSGVGTKTVGRELDKLMATKQVIKYDREKGRYLAAIVLSNLAKKAQVLLTTFHEQNSMLPGMPLEQLRTTLSKDLEQRLFKLLIDSQVRAQALVQQGDVIRLASHRVLLDEAKSKIEQAVRNIYEETGFAPLRVTQIAERVKQPDAEVLDLVHHLTRTGFITHVSGDMYVPTAALDKLRRRLIDHLSEHKEISTQDFKSMVGASRKHVIPLAEFFDQEKTTIRRGQIRILRKQSSG
ncbi:MAG: selenocysteine-specific translation elongation factor [Deltaproteobacteria bacterium]|nr:selenocysteine-specific translation elongation factor [Deltaproteobacteria bacterium]